MAKLQRAVWFTARFDQIRGPRLALHPRPLRAANLLKPFAVTEI
jgi:hypothetical protein